MIATALLVPAGVLAAASPEILSPVVEQPEWKLFVVVAAYVLTLASSGVVVRRIAGNPQPAPTPGGVDPERALRQKRLGRIIGKCENIITVTFILTGQETGLALIFAAKSIVRRDDIKNDPDYYLGGTLVNLVWSLVVAMAARALIAGF